MNLAPRAKAICRHLLGDPNPEHSTKDQWRYGAKGSLAVEVDGDQAGTFYDFENKVGGSMLELISREKGFSNGEAFAWLRSELGIGDDPHQRGAKYKVTGTWPYRDRDGTLLYRVVRRDCPGKEKRIHQERYDPTTGQFVGEKGCMKSVRYVPYRLPDWLDGDGPILIPEGERKVDALYGLKRRATCNAGGAGKFSRGFAPYFEGRDVVLLPDNDEVGRDHVRQIAEILKPVAASIRILALPNLPPKGDIIDWLAAGGTAEQLRALVDGAPAAEDVIATWGRPKKSEDTGSEAPERQGPFMLARRKVGDRHPGVYRLAGEEEDAEEWRPVCSQLEVLATTRDAESANWGRLLEIHDRDGVRHLWPMPAEMLAGDCVEFRRELLRLGLDLVPGNSNRNALADYVTMWRPSRTVRCVDRVGWHGDAFVLPDATFGGLEEVVLQTTGAAPEFNLAGSLEGWREEIAAPAAGNSRIVFAISLGFTGPLLRLAGEESGGVHLKGASSKGKTAALHGARSVPGVPKGSWRTTDNAAEGLARASCDCLLTLDEIGQAPPRVVGELAYMLGNERGKGRMRRDATARKPHTWRVLFLSTGETGVSARLLEGGERARAGQEVRVLEIPGRRRRRSGHLRGSPRVQERRRARRAPSSRG
jgi:putative DNA primase/helicase